MANNSFIKHLDYYIPEDRLSLNNFIDTIAFDKISAFNRKEDFKDYLEEYLPLQYLCIEKKYTLGEMIMNLIKKNIENGGIQPEKIDYLIMAFENPEKVKLEHKIQEYLNVNNNINIIQLSGNYCANIDIAIGLAGELLDEIDVEKNVLIITGNKIESPEQRIVGSYGVLGDAVGLVVVSNVDDVEHIKIVEQSVIVEETLGQIDFMQNNTVLYYQSYLKSFNGAIEKSNIKISELGQVFLHNANTILPREVLAMYDIEDSVFYTKNRLAYGHLDTVDLIVNLKDYLKEVRHKSNLLVSLSIGVTGTFVTTIFQT